MAQNLNNRGRKTVLLSLGRLPVALDLARGFSAAGWRVIVAEPFAMHLARMSNSVDRCFQVTAPRDDAGQYLDDLSDIVRTLNVSLVLPVSEESLYVADLRQRLPNVDIFCMSQDHMLTLHDKFAFVELAGSYGLAVPESSPAEDAHANRITANKSFVCKPRHSCSGRRVSFHPPGSQPPENAGMLVQETLAGEVFSSFTIARDGAVRATSVYRGVVYDSSVAVCFERVDDASDIEAWIGEFARLSRHTGFISFDFIRDESGQCNAIECNPRVTSGIHFLEAKRLPDLITGEAAATAGFRRARLLTESWSCLTAVLAALPSRASFRTRLRFLRQARDVSWSPQDPKPFLLMVVNTYRIIWLAFTRRQTFAQAAVQDIEWRQPSDGSQQDV